MSSPAQIIEWIQFELPEDQYSTQNAIIITNSRKWCLLIDPQNQGKNWLKKLYEKNGYKIGRLNDNNFFRTLENCI